MARYNLFVLKVPLNTKQTDRHHCTVCGAIYFKTAAAGALSSPRACQECVWTSLCNVCLCIQLQQWIHYVQKSRG